MNNGLYASADALGWITAGLPTDSQELAIADRARRVSRAPRSDGPRTTLRVPVELMTIADRLADELGVSRNDALLRLAARGAKLYEREHQIEEIRDQRWAAVLSEAPDVGEYGELPTEEEAREAIMRARESLFDLPPE